MHGVLFEPGLQRLSIFAHRPLIHSLGTVLPAAGFAQAGPISEEATSRAVALDQKASGPCKEEKATISRNQDDACAKSKVRERHWLLCFAGSPRESDSTPAG
jgi:hypothetical protein